MSAPAAAGGSSSGLVSYNASLPGLYGGTRNKSSCDKSKLVNFLQQNPAKASAWASTLGIQPSQISTYVSGLTDVLLRTDTRVTNHGYVNGTADPIQSVLEAGTAVLVDQYGQPVVKCYCGNPLTPPVLYSSPVYTGPVWSGFSTDRIFIINQSTTIINQFTLYDPTTGMEFTRGPHGTDGPYLTNPGGTNTSSQNTSTSGGNPSASLSPNPVPQGGTVTLSVSGFPPNASLSITVNRPDGGTDHDSISTGSTGTGTFTFPNTGGSSPVGTYNVTVTDQATGASASASIEVVGSSTTTTPSTSVPSTSTATPATTGAASTP